ncbi:guanine nucleotide-binding subunit alpha-12 isoform X2 [Labeo rohita]|uniref:Guanine nucleotide-binding subunit alpha-12 isoform X2 n=1 Tax=Labeo rohita TaxID=84645 RepID=A0A498P1R6_LABRO|nr:guanine nucleotide-binding subunit alpha-12 isoform X2 [Labeo rohita]
MSEPQSSEYRIQGARPKRSVRQPTYLQDFEVQYPGKPQVMVPFTQTAQQTDGKEDYHMDDTTGACFQGSRDYSSEEGAEGGTPDSLEVTGPQIAPWYLVTDQWSAQDDYTHSLPLDLRKTVHDLEKENRELRQSQLSMRQELRRLREIQQGMQDMLTRSQSSQRSSPTSKRQHSSPTPPVPSPRTIYKESQTHVPKPAPRAQPVPAPRKIPTPKSTQPYDADDDAHYVPPPVRRNCDDIPATWKVSAHVPSSSPEPYRHYINPRQPEMDRSAPSPSMPSAYYSVQPYGLPATRPGWQMNVNRQETTYRGPQPTIPDFIHRDPGEFARLKLALGNLLPEDATELFKYQVLVDHLKLMEARLIADSFLNSPTPYSDTMAALTERFGRPHQLALSRIAAVMDSLDVQSGDNKAFECFALQIQALVGLLKTLGTEGEVELRCGSHVA